jgi:hypothetical protein
LLRLLVLEILMSLLLLWDLAIRSLLYSQQYLPDL